MRKPTDHWRRGDRTAHPDCSACLSLSKFGTVSVLPAPSDDEPGEWDPDAEAIGEGMASMEDEDAE